MSVGQRVFDQKILSQRKAKQIKFTNSEVSYLTMFADRFIFISLTQPAAIIFQIFIKCSIFPDLLPITFSINIVKRVSWFKSSLLLRIQNKHKHKH
jgi:hypothetical protein